MAGDRAVWGLLYWHQKRCEGPIKLLRSFVLATPVLFYTGSEFFKGAKIAIKNASPNMDLLVITGASITYIYSILYDVYEKWRELF